MVGVDNLDGGKGACRVVFAVGLFECIAIRILSAFRFRAHDERRKVVVGGRLEVAGARRT